MATHSSVLAWRIPIPDALFKLAFSATGPGKQAVT